MRTQTQLIYRIFDLIEGKFIGEFRCVELPPVVHYPQKAVRLRLSWCLNIAPALHSLTISDLLRNLPAAVNENHPRLEI